MAKKKNFIQFYVDDDVLKFLEREADEGVTTRHKVAKRIVTKAARDGKAA